ncbi:hypothetical protein TRFO_12168 [Tritrichomonas foetus]|uniref:Uncharacterized protein n=1 Tax=Tritrichomonas foetus TaxID=1144522 RepID=A0A1J4J2L8_9EUKA|nr:hypothetical protein TRFO_12168 [Tritrichomonas foetus]|eukprot:OHS92977.1 hypothetical protein TRFO_12168 [Tritrichomonas foetus]
MIDDTGRSAIVEKISSIKNNSMIFVESIGMKLESVFPDFSAVYPDPPIDKVPQKYTLPKYIEIVRTVLSDFSQLESCLNRINTKNLNKVPPGEQAQVEKYTVQSLFTEDGGFSPVFMAVAKRMHIDIPENTNLGPSINPKNRK